MILVSLLMRELAIHNDIGLIPSICEDQVHKEIAWVCLLPSG